MQIMVEGLALGAFGTLYEQTKEPLLENLLMYVIQDEARHVHYGVLALRDHMKLLSDAEKREREDWAAVSLPIVSTATASSRSSITRPEAGAALLLPGAQCVRTQ